MKTSGMLRFARRWLGFLSLLAWGLTTSRVAAHEPFDFSSRLTIYDEHLELVLTFGNDGMRQFLSGAGFSTSEITDRLKSLGPDRPVTYPVTLAPRLYELKINGEPLPATGVRSVSEGAEILVTLTFPRPSTGSVEVRAACYETVPGLRNGVLTVHDEATGPLDAAMLSPASPELTVVLPDNHPIAQTAAPALSRRSSPPSHPSFKEYFGLGVHHILSGIDHLLFLAALLIGVRKPAAMLAIITCFTLAHSATLALAALNLVTISSRIVEPLIAASIIVVCVANFVRQNAENDRLWLAGIFGLIHGFGFASALRETGLGSGGASIVMPLFSFNLGVETGQLAVAAIFVPLLFLLRRSPGFVRYGTPVLSSAVILVSSYWLVQRMFL